MRLYMENTEREELIEAVLQYGVEELEFASQELLGDREFIAELVRAYDGDYQEVLEYASEEIQADSKFITELAGIGKNAERENIDEEHGEVGQDLADEDISIRLEDVVERDRCGNKSYILSLIEDFGAQAFEYASEELKRDPDVVFEAVRENKAVLEHASEDLKNDRYFIAKLLQDSNLSRDEILNYASKELKEDIRTFRLLDTYDIEFDILNQTTKDVAGDIDVILTLLEYEPERALELAAPSLRGNKEFFLKLLENYEYGDILMKEYGSVLEYAEGSIQNDEEVVLAAIRQFGAHQLEGAGSELLGNGDFFLELLDDEWTIRECGIEVSEILPYISAELLKNKDFILSALNSKYMDYEDALEMLEIAAKEPFEDKEFVLQLVDEMGGKTVKYASEELRADREVVLEAISDCGLALEFASEELRGDREIVLEALKESDDAVIFASDELKQNDRQIKRLVELVNERNSKREEMHSKWYSYDQIADAIAPTESMIKAVQAEMIEEMEKATEPAKDTQGQDLE